MLHISRPTPMTSSLTLSSRVRLTSGASAILDLSLSFHGRRNIKTIDGAHSAECQSPGTKRGSLNLSDLNDRF